MSPSDERLIARAQAGDRRSFDELVSRSYSLVYNTAYRILGDRDQAADATQSAYVRAYRSLRSFRGSATFTTWLYRIVTNTCLDMVRGRHRHLRSLSGDAEQQGTAAGDTPDERPGPERRALQAELQQAVHAALGRLRPEHRTVLVLYDLAGLSYDEIASVLGLPLGTVKSRLNRARHFLREEMTAYWEPTD